MCVDFCPFFVFSVVFVFCVLSFSFFRSLQFLIFFGGGAGVCVFGVLIFLIFCVFSCAAFPLFHFVHVLRHASSS